MYKILLTSFVVLGVFGVSAQEKNEDITRVEIVNQYEGVKVLEKNEIRLNAFDLILHPALSISYERLVNESNGYGISLFANFGDNNTSYQNFSLTPYYRFYFLNRKDYGASGLFVEAFSSFSSVDFNENSNSDSSEFQFSMGVGLGKKWVPLAWLFAAAGMVGTLPVFQVNQLVQIIRDTVAIPNGLTTADSHFNFDLILGIVLAVIAFAITVGNVKRVSAVAGKMVPAMVIFYFAVTAVLLVSHIEQVPSMLLLIVTDAFSGQAVSGGVIGTVILIGVQRGAFSNEAGIGTESLAHGAAKTNEPAREGLVAMVGPIADTLIVCTCTALTLLVTGVWEGGAQGVSMAAEAYEQVFPGFGSYLLLIMVFVLSMTTVLTYWYYGSKCMGFLFGAHREKYYLWAYMLLIVAGSVVSLDIVINLLDGAYATMAIPTMVSTLLLAPKVKAVATNYFTRLDAGEFD